MAANNRKAPRAGTRQGSRKHYIPPQAYSSSALPANEKSTGGWILCDGMACRILVSAGGRIAVHPDYLNSPLGASLQRLLNEGGLS